MRHRALLLLLAMIWAVAGPPAMAQRYPSQSVRIIVPFGPGSGSDIVARRIAAHLQEQWKQAVVIDNRPGAQGVIGTEMLRNAPADGYTLGISTNSTHAAAAFLHRKLPYDPQRHFEHIALIGVGGSVALVPRDSPFKSIADLVGFARSHPGKVLYGHADTSSQVPAALLSVRAGIAIEGVPYKASTSIITDLIGGQIQVAFFNYMTGASQVEGGRLVPIGITEASRNAAWPGVPAVAELLPGYEVTFFVGLSAPSGVPPGVVTVIRNALLRALGDGSVREPLQVTGLRLVQRQPDRYARFILAETERWREYIKAAGLQPQ